jgi:hypothetical protein
MRDLHVKILALCLAGLGLLMTFYKVERIGLPLTPGEAVPIWILEARVSFQATGGSAKAALARPFNPPGFTIIDEDFISSTFGLSVEGEGADRRARWAVRRASGQQTLYYRVSLVPEEASTKKEAKEPKPTFPDKPDYPAPEGAAIDALLKEVRERSADVESFTRELLVRLKTDLSNENIKLLRKAASTPEERAEQAVEILSGARIPSRLIWGLPLREGSRIGDLTPVVELHDGNRWIPLALESG